MVLATEAVDSGRGYDSNIKYITLSGYLTAGIQAEDTSRLLLRHSAGGEGAVVSRLHCTVSGRLYTEKGLGYCPHACACSHVCRYPQGCAGECWCIPKRLCVYEACIQTDLDF